MLTQPPFVESRELSVALWAKVCDPRKFYFFAYESAWNSKFAELNVGVLRTLNRDIR